MSQMKKPSPLDVLFWMIIGIGVLVRIWSFPHIPPGLNQDEAATAYDAYALLEYGIDRNGYHNPAVLVSWGSGMQALPAYIMMPFMYILGPTIAAIRLPSVLLGILSLPLLFFLVQQIFRKRTALIAMGLLAIAPGHIMLSRWGHEATYYPTFLLIGAVLIVLSLRHNKLFIVSALVLALSMYTYATAYLVTPVFFTLSTLYIVYHKKLPPLHIVTAWILFIVLCLPLGLFLLINEYNVPSIITPFISIPSLTGVPRYETIGNSPLSVEFLTASAQNIWVAIRLLFTQNDGLLWNSLPRFGVIYLYSTPFVLFGFFLLIRKCIKRTFDPAMILLIWCISCIALSMFIPININRAYVAIFPLVICAAIGISYLFRDRLAMLILAIFYFISFIQFSNTYFTKFPDQSAEPFFASLQPAVEHAVLQTSESICVTGNINMPYIFTLLYAKGNPYAFLETVVYDNPGAEFQGVRSYDRFTFGLDQCPDNTNVFVVRNNEAEQFTESEFSLTRFDLYTVAVRTPTLQPL